MNAPRRVLAAMSALTLALAACDHTKATRQSDTTDTTNPLDTTITAKPTVATIVSLRSGLVGIVGNQSVPLPLFQAVTQAGVGVPFAMLHFSASDFGGVDDSIPADSSGKRAVSWILGAKPGTQTITVTSGSATAQVTARAVARPAVIDLPDTIRFTRGNQLKTGFLSVRDGDGAPLTYYNLGASWAGVGDVTIPYRNDSAVASLRGGATIGTGFLTVFSALNTNVRDSAVIVTDIIPASATPNFVEPEATLVVGTFRHWSVVLADSAGVGIAGLEKPTFASTNPSVVQVFDSGFSGISAGTATVTATWRGRELLSVPVAVFPALDLGSVHTRPLSIGGSCPVTGLRSTPLSSAVRKTICLGPPDNANWQVYPDGGAQLNLPSSNFVFDGATAYAALSPLALSARTATTPGTERWSRSLAELNTCAGPGQPTVSVSSSGAVVFLNTGCGIAAVDSNSNVKWESMILHGDRGIAAVGDSLYILGNSAITLAGADGTARWTAPTSNVDFVAVMSNGSLAVDQELRAMSVVSNAGALVWRLTDLPDSSTGAWMVLDPQDNIYRSSGKKVYSLTPSGTIRWETTLPTLAGQLMFASDGLLYMSGAFAGHVFAINPATGAVLSRTPAGAAKCTFSFPTNWLVQASLATGRLWTTNACGTVNWYDVPFGPATGWSQAGGSPGYANSRFIPR